MVRPSTGLHHHQAVARQLLAPGQEALARQRFPANDVAISRDGMHMDDLLGLIDADTDSCFQDLGQRAHL
jgi:hypothetical protein